jgi:hypothetical protein
VPERLDDVADPPTSPPDDDYAGTDLVLFVPERLAQAVGRRRAAWTPIDTVAAWLVGLHLLLLAVIVGRGSFYIDDLQAQGSAVGQPFWHFILSSNGTHFALIPRALDWAQSRYVPLQHAPAVAITLLVRALLAIGFWRVLRRLFGARRASLVPLAVLLLTPALIPATTWYWQSITILGCTVAIVWAVDAQLRWVLYRHRSDLVVLVAVTAVGLGCYQKAALIPVVLLGLTLAIFTSWRGPRASSADRSAASAGLLGALVSGAVVFAFLLMYRSGPYDQGGTTPAVRDVLHLGWNASTRTVIPLLLGGPYSWASSEPYSGDPQLSPTVVAFSLVIVLIGLAVAFRRGPDRTVRALVLLLAWLVPSVAIIAAGRFTVFGLTLASATRLWADLVPGFLLAGALAVLPWRIGVSRGPAGPKAAQPDSRADGGPLEITTGVLATALLIVIVLGGSLISSLSYASTWWQNPTGRWIANARASLVNAEPYPRTLATPLPESVMPYWVAPTFPTDAPLLLLLRPDMRFYDGDGEAKVMDASGVRTSYVPQILAETKPAKLCVATVPAGSSSPVPVPLPKAAPYALGAQVEVGLLLAESTKVEVTVVTPEGKILTPQRFSDVELPAGPHTLRLPVPFGQAISTIQVQIHGTQGNCIAFGRVWAPST